MERLYVGAAWLRVNKKKGGVKANLCCGGTAEPLGEKDSSFSVQSCLLPLSNLCDQNTYHPLCSVCFLPGRMYGADDFLPMLTYVVAQCDMPQLDTEIQYMMELLDPSLLQGEGRPCPFAPFLMIHDPCLYRVNRISQLKEKKKRNLKNF